MAITQVELTNGTSTTDATSFATASITPSANQLVLLSISASAASAVPTPTVTGNSLTWQLVATHALTSSSRSVFVFRTMGASPAAGAVTIDFGATTITGIVWSISEFAGIDTSGTNGSGAIVQSLSAQSAGTENVTITLAAFASTTNATFGAFNTASGSAAGTAGAGFTLIHYGTVATPSTKLVTEWLASEDTTVNCSWSVAAQNAGVAIEIKEAGGGPPLVVSRIRLFPLLGVA